MHDKENAGCGTNFREAVCIHTDKVFDSCRDKDCLSDIRVYLTQQGQEVVDRAISIKCTRAEIIWVFSDIDRSKHNKRYIAYKIPERIYLK